MTTAEVIREFLLQEVTQDRKLDLSLDYPLLENHVLDSAELFALVAFLEDKFEIEIQNDELVPANFGTLRAISDMVERKQLAV